MRNHESERVIYLAGGCFWGMEKLMRVISGVSEVTSGYINGEQASNANYKAVCAGDTGFKEAVRVQYDPQKVNLTMLLAAYFYVIDPTAKNRQGNDVGSQYQAGIYYEDEDTKFVAEQIAAIEAKKHEIFTVEIEPLTCFYPAEEYHQRYLDKNPNGYCHISAKAIELFSNMTDSAVQYTRPSEEIIRKNLTEEQYKVTQQNATERPFSSPYYKSDEKGLYVDVVTGEPLFLSTQKYLSSCGWPSFFKPISDDAISEQKDTSYRMIRTEVRSQIGDSHLGHVFEGDAESPNGIRYCINGAALKFIPYKEMEAKGYGHLLSLFDS